MLVPSDNPRVCENTRASVIDLTNVDFSEAKSFKQGEACGVYILGLFGPFLGDARIVDAVKSANIKKVTLVDYRSAWYLLFSKNCVVVYGE